MAHDLAARPLYVCMRSGDDYWPVVESCVRVQAIDLRDASRRCAALRADAATRDCPVLLDVEVLIDHDAASARNTLAQLETTHVDSASPRLMRYVGTSRGLAGLIADIHVLGIADGVMLIPLTQAGVVEKVVDEVLPMLGLAPVFAERLLA
jgi:alkanesulfonate monooxygenase SsuD/methylene tetrahydromethanopterin reductase-like flavin-dependent oxidoreductase (luciferase family)